jgi:hypothetical protein
VAAGGQRAHGGGEAVKRRQAAFVAILLAGLAGKGGVDVGRFAVCDRVADDAIMVGH